MNSTVHKLIMENSIKRCLKNGALAIILCVLISLEGCSQKSRQVAGQGAAIGVQQEPLVELFQRLYLVGRLERLFARKLLFRCIVSE